jgi:hypothetical protein
MYTIISAGAIFILGLLLIIFGSLGKIFKWLGILLTILSLGYLIAMFWLPPF